MLYSLLDFFVNLIGRKVYKARVKGGEVERIVALKRIRFEVEKEGYASVHLSVYLYYGYYIYVCN
jgi:hypothetical protein